jgi:ubiquitin-conjugating enzyme E2 O
VSFGRGLLRQGIVNHVAADTFQILLIDDSVVDKKAGDMRVLDRSHLYPGQVVGSTSDIAGQLGVVTGVTTLLDLAEHDNTGTATGRVIKDVSPCSLRRVTELNHGDFVVSGPWLGQVVEVSVDVDVRFDDGAVCKVRNADSENLEDATRTQYRRFQMNCDFYPGQRVRSPCSLFRAGTVIKVEMSGVLVYWIASMHCGTDKALVEASAPPAYQHADDLTFFCAASTCSWWVADHCYFREHTSAQIDDDNGDVQDQEEEEEDDPCSEDHQDVIDADQQASVTHVVPPTKQNDRRAQVRRHVEVEFPMAVANTSTSVDVLWQNGTLQHGIPSATLVPFDIKNEQEFFPGQHVVENPFDTSVDANGAIRRVGIVTSMDCKDQTVRVSWFKEGMCHDEAREIDCTDTVSAYDLKPDHYAFYGDIVVRLLQSGSTEDGGSVVLQGRKKKGVVADLSWVGRVVGLPDGQVQVKWGDGSMSTVRGSIFSWT